MVHPAIESSSPVNAEVLSCCTLQQSADLEKALQVLDALLQSLTVRHRYPVLLGRPLRLGGAAGLGRSCGHHQCLQGTRVPGASCRPPNRCHNCDISGHISGEVNLGSRRPAGNLSAQMCGQPQEQAISLRRCLAEAEEQRAGSILLQEKGSSEPPPNLQTSREAEHREQPAANPSSGHPMPKLRKKRE